MSKPIKEMIDSKAPSLQDFFIDELINTKKHVNVFLMNGIKLSGNIKSADRFTVNLISQETNQLIYKHAISTIVETQHAAAVRQHKERSAHG